MLPDQDKHFLSCARPAGLLQTTWTPAGSLSARNVHFISREVRGLVRGGHQTSHVCL